jgi:hypothetical protein
MPLTSAYRTPNSVKNAFSAGWQLQSFLPENVIGKDVAV